MLQLKKRDKMSVVAIEPNMTDGIFSSDDNERKKKTPKSNRVMPQTDIEYEREQIVNHKIYVHTDDEASIRGNEKMRAKVNNSKDMHIYEND